MASVTRKLLQSGQLTAASTTGSSATLEAQSMGFVGWLRVSACNAATTVNVSIQHSADGTNFVALTSFTAIAGTTGTEAKQITSSVLPYVRAVITLSGATLDATMDVALYFDKYR